jgi:chromosome segregation ATPase
MSAQSIVSILGTLLGLIVIVVPAAIVVIYSVRKSVTEVLSKNADILKQNADAEKARADRKDKEYSDLEAKCKQEMADLELRLTTENEAIKTRCSGMEEELKQLKFTYHEIQEFTFTVQRKNEKLAEEAAALKVENARLLTASLAEKHTQDGETIG